MAPLPLIASVSTHRQTATLTCGQRLLDDVDTDGTLTGRVVAGDLDHVVRVGLEPRDDVAANGVALDHVTRERLVRVVLLVVDDEAVDGRQVLALVL